MVQHSNPLPLDSFIAQKEMLDTNGKEENIQIYSIYQCYKWLASGI